MTGERPTSALALLFTDVEDSTPLLHALGPRATDVLTEHSGLIRSACEAEGGIEVRSEGDGHVVVFEEVAGAVSAALSAQRALGRHAWPDGVTVRVRMGVHRGPVTRVGDDYLGLAMAVCARIAAAAHGGQVILSGDAAEALPGHPPHGTSLVDLGEHLLKGFPDTTRLYELRHPDLPTGFPEPRTQSATPHNLPVPPTPMVGREDLLERIKALLASDARLVTLTGLGGMGKTRTALEAARAQLAYRTGGVWFCDLTATHHAGAVETVITRAMGIKEKAGLSAGAQLRERLAAAPTLLVLDNFEHLLDAAPAIADLLDGSPTTKALVTSRVRLDVADESVLTLEPLTMPTHEVASSEAVDLFVARAKAAKAAFALDESTTAGAVAVVERCQGIPLAIELAAAHVRTATLEDIAAALRSGIDLLSGGDRDLPERHQALRACIGWTYDTLDPDEARAFRALATFVGGAPLEEIDEVCGDGTRAQISALAERSLVRIQDGRAFMLEPLRLYGAERQSDHDETEALARRHGDWVVSLARWADRAVADENDALATVHREQDNVRAAFTRPTTELRQRAEIAIGLARFWMSSGNWSEGRSWLEAVLDDPALPRTQRGRALIVLGYLKAHQGALDDARADLEEALTLVAGDHRRESQALSVATELARIQGRLQESVELGERALAAGRKVPEPNVARSAHSMLAYSYMLAGRIDDAAAAFHEIRAGARAEGDERSLAVATSGIAACLKRQGKVDEAEDLYMEALRAERAMGNRTNSLTILNNLASIWLEHRRDHERALAAFQEALVEARTLGDRNMITGSYYNISMCYSATDDRRTAEYALRAAEGWQALGNVMWSAIALANAAVGSVTRDPDAASRYLREALDRAGDDPSVRSHVLRVYGDGLQRVGIDGWDDYLMQAREQAALAERPDLIALVDDILHEVAQG